MGRPKKITIGEVKEVEEIRSAIIPPEILPTCAPTVSENTTAACVSSLYDPRGLRNILNLTYPLKPNGFVDWKSLISDEHIVLNKAILEKKGINLDGLTDEDFKALKEKTDDSEKLIKLSGYKELALLRGYLSCVTDVNFYGDRCVAKCTIKWRGNFETDYQTVKYTGVADACEDNTNNFSNKYLTCIAENRAFIRCVRNFLQIHIAGQDEIKTETPSEISESPVRNYSATPLGTLARKLLESKKTFNEMLQFVMNKYQYSVKSPENWTRIEDISLEDATFILGKFQEFYSK